MMSNTNWINPKHLKNAARIVSEGTRTANGTRRKVCLFCDSSDGHESGCPVMEIMLHAKVHNYTDVLILAIEEYETTRDEPYDRELWQDWVERHEDD